MEQIDIHHVPYIATRRGYRATYSIRLFPIDTQKWQRWPCSILISRLEYVLLYCFDFDPRTIQRKMEFCLFVLFCFPPNPFCYCAGSSLVLKSIHTCSTEFKNNIRSKTCRSCSQFFSICRSVVELIIPRHYHIIVMDYQYYLSVLLPCKSQNICYMRWTGVVVSLTILRRFLPFN